MVGLDKKIREGVKFTDKSPTNVFMTSRTILLDLQRNIVTKFGLDGRKEACDHILSDSDLCHGSECELASSGGSAPNPRPVNVGGASGSRNQREIDVPQVASPPFDFNLQVEAAMEGNELGDSRSFGELGFAMAATPQPVSPPAFEGVPDPDPHVGEALRPDDSDEELEFIEGDSDDEACPVPAPQGGTSSSGTQQYPPHLSNLNLDALSGPGRGASGSSSGET
ncbi:hypothetical protein PIB30_041732 [Stylosanthes scabra]|uniref:Uncharacterized protein n=1 Tax=Stylosanthes scabra TaxID=79078 RepID=A0ABU6ZDT4_9FABA|nr:hypothetical protein [Stylosanthes scabra]